MYCSNIVRKRVHQCRSWNGADHCLKLILDGFTDAPVLGYKTRVTSIVIYSFTSTSCPTSSLALSILHIYSPPDYPLINS